MSETHDNDKDAWAEIRGLIEGKELELGPYFGHQVQDSPWHLLFTYSRYKFANRLISPRGPQRLLEIGCSEGVGTMMFAASGHNVTAMDADADAIGYARQKLTKSGIDFQAGNFIGKKLGEFDVVVTLDVIEHIEPSEEAGFFDSICANLKQNGVCLIGTPNDCASQHASKASQIGHINMYTAERLYASAAQYFQNCFIFGMNDEVMHTGFYPMCHYLFVLCCTPKHSTVA